MRPISICALGSVLLACSCTPVVAGSGGTAASSKNPAPTFDPCSALSQQQIAGMTADPASVRPYSTPETQTEVGCRWDSVNRSPSGAATLYTIAVGTSAAAIDLYRDNPRFTSSPLSIAGRQAVDFAADPGDDACSIALPIRDGSVIVAISPGFMDATRETSCAAARTAAEATAPALPAE